VILQTWITPTRCTKHDIVIRTPVPVLEIFCTIRARFQIGSDRIKPNINEQIRISDLVYHEVTGLYSTSYARVEVDEPLMKRRQETAKKA
jgi:hypothetical protein